MGPPLQDFLCAFEPADRVFPVAHSANCCVQVEPTSEAAYLLNLQFNRERTGAIPARRQSERYRAHLARKTLSLCWPLNQHPALLECEDRTLLVWYPSLTHLAREGRMTLAIGRRKLLVALGGAAAVAGRGARAAVGDSGGRLSHRRALQTGSC